MRVFRKGHHKIGMKDGKYTIILLLAIVAFLAVLILSIYGDVKKQNIVDLNVQQMAYARQAARGIQDHMEQVIHTLDFFAQLPQIKTMSGEGKEILAAYQKYHNDEIRGITRVDKHGRIVYAVPYSAEMACADLSGQDHIRKVTKTHKPVISDVFMAVQGFRSVAVHVPVFRQGAYDGTIAFLLSFDVIAKNHIENIRVGKNGYAWVISEKGYVISSPIQGQVGKSAFEVYKNHTRILAMISEMLKGKEGTAAYYYNHLDGIKNEKSLKHAVYLPIAIGNTFWSIAVATPEDEAMASMKGFHVKLIVMIAALVLLCVAYTYFIVSSRAAGREQKAREAIVRALEESEALYRALIETTNTGFVIIDFEGRVIDANMEYVHLTGHKTLKEIRGRNVLEWTASSDKERNREAVERCLREGRIKNFEVDYRDKSGQTTSIEINATVVEKEGNGRILTLCRDIKDRKKLEAQLLQAHKMESVGRLAGGVAHDFNNMLSVIIGYAETALRKMEPSDPLYHNLEEVLKAGRRSADLTRQLLAFARRQIVHPRVLDLNETVAGMLAMLQRLIGEEIHLLWKPGKELWHLRMDPSQIDQILANLLVNAKDAIVGPGKVIIETVNVLLDDAYCTSHLGCRAGEYVLLAISDNGCGMEKELLANIFDPFFTTKDIGEGTGLGLATVYGIVKQNGGYINVYSEPGKGTTVKLYLPRYAGHVAETSEKQEVRPLKGGNETVLIVEDDKAVLELATGMLEDLGYKVLAAKNPTVAVKIAKDYQGPIDLLLTDVVMPDMNGKELCQRLLETRPELKCLYMSGYTSEIIADHGILEDGVHFMQKPFSLKVLAERVRQVLD